MAKTRQVNHLAHHQAMSSKTLMRRGVNQPEVNRRQIKANHAFNHHKNVLVAPHRQTTINAARSDRAALVEKSQYISHFAMPIRSHFVPTAVQPIKSIVHKPEVESVQNIDQLMMKAIDNVQDQLLNLEQQPVRRLHRFSRSLVANRFNGVALD